MADNNAGGTVETPNVEDLQNQLQAEKDARAKAEAKIVEMKKSSEGKTETNNVEDNGDNKKEEAPATFGKEDVDAMIKAALKEAAINSQEEKFEQNQTETNESSISGEEGRTTTSGMDVKTLSEYESMSPESQRDYIKQCTDKFGELTFGEEEF